jgi:hypothetical protein
MKKTEVKKPKTACERLNNLILEMRANKVNSIHLKSKKFKKGSYIDVDHQKHLQIYLTQLDLFLVDGRGKTFFTLITENHIGSKTDRKILRLPVSNKTIFSLKKNHDLCPSDDELAAIKIETYLKKPKVIHAMI